MSRFWKKGASWTFTIVLLSVAFGVGGAASLVVGSKCRAWDREFEAVLGGANLSWKQALAIVSIGLALLAISLWIYISL
jgi:hypothetical protein